MSGLGFPDITYAKHYILWESMGYFQNMNLAKLFSALAQRLQARFQNPGSSGYVGDYAICPVDILCYLGIRISYSKGPY